MMAPQKVRPSRFGFFQDLDLLTYLFAPEKTPSFAGQVFA